VEKGLDTRCSIVRLYTAIQQSCMIMATLDTLLLRAAQRKMGPLNYACSHIGYKTTDGLRLNDLYLRLSCKYLAAIRIYCASAQS